MPNDIIIALIGFFGVCVTQYFLSKRATNELLTKLDKQSELADQRLDAKIQIVDTELKELRREVREHNNFARRMPVLEEKVANLERKVG